MKTYRVRWHNEPPPCSVRIHATDYVIRDNTVFFYIETEQVAVFNLKTSDFWRELDGEPPYTEPNLAWQPDEEWEE
jgi:hypothetical protein